MEGIRELEYPVNPMVNSCFGVKGVNLAPTNKAKCALCRSPIIQGTPRLWYLSEFLEQGKKEKKVIKRFICFNCASKAFSYSKSNLQEELGRLVSLEYKFEVYMMQEEVKKRIKEDKILRELEK